MQTRWRSGKFPQTPQKAFSNFKDLQILTLEIAVNNRNSGVTMDMQIELPKARPPMSTARDKRQDVRFTAEEAETIEKAASWKGISVTDFMRSASLESARNTISDQNYYALSSRDWDNLMSALQNPPEPNDTLKKLAALRR